MRLNMYIYYFWKLAGEKCKFEHKEQFFELQCGSQMILTNDLRQVMAFCGVVKKQNRIVSKKDNRIL